MIGLLDESNEIAAGIKPPYASIGEMRRTIELIGRYVKEVEDRLSVHDSIMDAASAGLYEMSGINEAIYFTRDTLTRLKRINEVMEGIGGEVSMLKWEIGRMRS